MLSQYKKLGNSKYKKSEQSLFSLFSFSARPIVFIGLYFFRKEFSMKRKVIIDCDPGVDDSLALMFALNSPNIEVIGITIVCGNSPVEMGFENAKKVLAKMNRLNIPIFVGADKPLKKEFVNALDTHGSDGLGESFLDPIQGYEQKQNAVEFLKESLHKEKVSIIAIGPLTNLAMLIQEDEQAFQNIDQLVSMGGAFRIHGNCSPVAEYNYWCDPDAAQIVYKAALKHHKIIHMVGLDVTRKIVLTPTLLEYLIRLDEDLGNFVKRITKFYYDFHWKQEHILGCVINDPLAIAYFIDPSICQGIDRYVDIATQGIAQGQSIVDHMNFYQKDANAHILTETNVQKFFKLFYSTLLNIKEEKLDILDQVIKEN